MQTRLLLTAALLTAAPAALLAQGKYGATPADSATCVQNMSLWVEFVKQSNYADALEPWRICMRTCPQSSKNMYIDGVKIRKHFADKEKDAARKAALVDSIYLVYDQRITAFGEAGYVLGRKAIDMMKYSPDRGAEILRTLEQSVQERGAKSEAGVLAAYYQALSNSQQDGQVTKDRMMEEYVTVMGHIESNLQAGGGELYEKARDNVNELFMRVADCSDIGRLVDNMLQQRPDDQELKGRMLKVLNSKECTELPVYQRLAEEVHRASPTSESAYSLGLYLAKKGDMSGSLKYMKEAVDLCSGCSDKIKYLLKAGQVASAAGSHAQSRTFANQVLALDPKNGEAYMLIGHAVSSQGSGCDEPQAWGPNWLAYDYYQKARSMDPNVAEKAADRMAACAARFPEQAKMFFHQITEGQSFQVTCGGLNETTTARARK